MIIRTYFKCLTCDQEHLFRIQIGLDSFHKYEVNCSNCEEKMIIAMSLDQELGKINKIEAIENCEHISDSDIPDDEDFPCFYLCNDFPVTESEKTSRTSFPSHRLLKSIYTRTDLQSLNRNPSNAYNPNILPKWKIVEKVWSLTKNNKLDLANEKIHEYYKFSDLYDNSLESLLYDFLIDLLAINSAKIEIFNAVTKWMISIPIKELKKFKNFFDKNYNEHQRRYFEVLRSFLNNYSEFSQVQFLDYLPTNLTTTSNAFDKIKMFYGECFEHVTSNMEFLACLFNIKNGREYDTFKSMNLAGYNSLDKAKKLDPMEYTPEIRNIFDSFNSKLRNASHHGHIYFDKNVVKFKTSQDKNYNEMQYIEYLTECRKLFESLCIMILLEIIFKKLICQKLTNIRAPNQLSLAIKKSIYN